MHSAESEIHSEVIAGEIKIGVIASLKYMKKYSFLWWIFQPDKY
jgi:hypothetical protein